MKFRNLALAASLGLCATAPAFAVTEIQWWHSMDGALETWVNDLAKDFNSKQADYKVVPVYKGQYPEALTAAIARNTMILHMDHFGRGRVGRGRFGRGLCHGRMLQSESRRTMLRRRPDRKAFRASIVRAGQDVYRMTICQSCGCAAGKSGRPALEAKGAIV